MLRQDPLTLSLSPRGEGTPELSFHPEEEGRSLLPLPVRIRLRMRTFQGGKLAEASLRGRGTEPAPVKTGGEGGFLNYSTGFGIIAGSGGFAESR